MEKLVTGVHKFRDGYFSRHKDLYERLAHQQRPEVLFITCSDSRVLPNRLTQTEPGELFVIRNAGNMMPTYEEAKGHFSGEAATLQYAVEVLGIRDIIVCGHTDCGAVKALLNPPASLKELDLVSFWIEQEAQLREHVAQNYGDRDPERQLIAGIEENVLFQIQAIKTYPFVRKRLEEGTLKLHAWVYHIGRGMVFAYNPEAQQFESIETVYRTEAGDLQVANL